MSLIILLNCLAMAYERPAIPGNSVEAAVLKYLDVAFIIIFGVEALLKMLAFTFRWGPAGLCSATAMQGPLDCLCTLGNGALAELGVLCNWWDQVYVVAAADVAAACSMQHHCCYFSCWNAMITVEPAARNNAAAATSSCMDAASMQLRSNCRFRP